MNRLVSLGASVLPVVISTAFAAGEITGLGDLPGGDFYSEAHAVNADGSVVVGVSRSAKGTEAFRWTQAGGMEGLGDLRGGNFYSEAHAVNADGSVVVGGSSGGWSEAFRWTQAGGMEPLVYAEVRGGFFSSHARAVNADGSVVVGIRHTSSGTKAVRWTQAGDIEYVGPHDSWAHAVNADGSVVVGRSSGYNRLFLPTLPPPPKESVRPGPEAFRWTQAGGMEGLGDLPGGDFYSEAYAVNADGSVVVGTSDSASGTEAFRWTEAGGMQSLAEWLAGFGVDVSGWVLSEVRGISSDGTVMVGTGSNSSGSREAFLAKARPNAEDCVFFVIKSKDGETVVFCL
jgi:probable HAF family extracellular repeat protein